MVKQAKSKKKVKGFGNPETQQAINIKFGAMVEGREVNFPSLASLLEFTATKGDYTMNGYIHPTIKRNGEICVRWLTANTLAGETPVEVAKAIINECSKKYNAKAAKAVKQRLKDKDYVIVTSSENNSIN